MIDNNKLELPEYIIRQIYNHIIKIPLDSNLYEIYKQFYKSMYDQNNLFESEYALQQALLELENQYQSDIFRFRLDNNYEWIKIYPTEIETIKYRYYIAPKPDNLHELVENLTEVLLENVAPVKFKYQLEDKMEDCDRIIIYCDSKNKNQVEKALLYLYQNKPHLFNECERAISWLYETSIPGIYTVPETPGFSYGLKFVDTLIKIRHEIEKNNLLSEENHYEVAKKIIISRFKENGLLFENSYEYENNHSKKM